MGKLVLYFLQKPRISTKETILSSFPITETLITYKLGVFGDGVIAIAMSSFVAKIALNDLIVYKWK